jgi:hypothetical protein
MKAEDLQEGIFNLNTRRFGSVAEFMVKRLVRLGKSKSLFHDLYDDYQKHRVEVKFSTVRRTNDRKITEDSILQAIEDELSANRHVSFADRTKVDFDCNIQQIKRDQFEVLYYGLFFSDRIVIFKINSAEIGPKIFYSDKQHKGNEGEGQFHVNNKTIELHLKNYLYKELTYQQLLELLR